MKVCVKGWITDHLEGETLTVDALTGIVWEDDGQIVDPHTKKGVRQSEPPASR